MSPAYAIGTLLWLATAGLALWMAVLHIVRLSRELRAVRPVRQWARVTSAAFRRVEAGW